MNDEAKGMMRKLWEVMKQNVFAPGSQVGFDYYLGFSHACSLAGVIDPFEWAAVQTTIGDAIASAKWTK